MSLMHEAMLEDVAVYALGALPSGEARRVRDHIATCAACASEYALLAPAVAVVGMSAEVFAEDRSGITAPSPMLKSRIMRQVRRENPMAPNAPARVRGSRTIVWPAYLVAAACFAIAIFSSLLNLSLMQQLRTSQAQVAAVQHRSSGLARTLVDERTALADIASDRAQRFNVTDGQIVRVNHHIYLTMHGMEAPPHGKVYQAWTIAKGTKTVAPSSTFVPDSHGSAVIALPVNADSIKSVAVSIEPEGGSKAPTSKPIILQTVD
ncbi:MAG: anti-sigma factor [Candidatus Eremiobacteraeota bacterium]|nr:anti-sigma factor [Candidatus Eremiobacteraeota bacterium]